MKPSFIYLGTPYSDPSPTVRKRRYEEALLAAGTLAHAGIPCYCPIAAWHQVGITYQLPGDHTFWLTQDTSMMDTCSEGWFILFEGASTSLGCKSERKYLFSLNKPLKLIYPEDLANVCQLEKFRWK